MGIIYEICFIFVIVSPPRIVFQILPPFPQVQTKLSVVGSIEYKTPGLTFCLIQVFPSFVVLYNSFVPPTHPVFSSMNAILVE